MKTLQKREYKSPATHYVVPLVDIKEQEDGVIIFAELPGIEREQLQIKIENGKLIILGEGEVHEENYTVVHRECMPHNFRRVFALDESIDTENVSAALKDGVLRLELKKAARLKPKRVEVKVE